MNQPHYDEEFLQSQRIVTGYHYHPVSETWIGAKRPHGLRDWTLHYTFSGLGVFEFAGGHSAAPVGSIVLIRPGVPHDYGLERKSHWEVLWSVFDPPADWAHWMQWPEVGPGHLQLQLTDPAIRKHVVRKLREMNRLASSTLPERYSLAINALEGALLWCQILAERLQRGPLDERVRSAAEFLCKNMSHTLSLDQTARHVGLSVPQLTRLFRKGMGCSAGEFLQRQRMTRAKQLLEHTVLDVCAIAWEVGFENAFYFTRRFGLAVGHTPSEYRKRFMPQHQPGSPGQPRPGHK